VRKQARPDMLVKRVSRESYRNRNGMLKNTKTKAIPGSNNYMQILKLKQQSISPENTRSLMSINQSASISMLAPSRIFATPVGSAMKLSRKGSRGKRIFQKSSSQASLINSSSLTRPQSSGSYSTSLFAKWLWDLARGCIWGKRVLYCNNQSKLDVITATCEDA
jgi:hypothetical protein